MENDGEPSGPTQARSRRWTRCCRRTQTSAASIHFYVHATENAGVPRARRALRRPPRRRWRRWPATWSTCPRTPEYRVGRYEDAAQANLAALGRRPRLRREDRHADAARAADAPRPRHLVRPGRRADGRRRRCGAALHRAVQPRLSRPAGLRPAAGVGAGQVYAALGRIAPPQSVLAAPDSVVGQAVPRGDAPLRPRRGLPEARRPADARAEAALVDVVPIVVNPLSHEAAVFRSRG